MNLQVLVATLAIVYSPLVFAQGGFAAILSDGHTVFFIGVNIALTLYFAGLRFNRFAVMHGPEILTTVGIFGCFWGIATALLDFDATKVSSSVPQLLEGVRLPAHSLQTSGLSSESLPTRVIAWIKSQWNSKNNELHSAKFLALGKSQRPAT